MKKIISLLILAALLLSCFALIACNGTSSNVVIVSTKDGSAEVLKAKIESKTGEKIDIVPANETDNKTAIYIKKNAQSFDAYGWTVDGDKVTLSHNVLTDFNVLADAFVSNISNLDSIKNVQTASFKVSAEDSIFDATAGMLATIDAKADTMKDSVLNATKFDPSTAKGTVYYVSNSGNDTNDGKSADSAWATLDKVNKAQLSAGDAVLFECESIFRGTVSAKAGVTYASYGTGNMPIIMGSKKNYAGSDLWELYDAQNNIWKLTEYVSDPGVIVFNARVDAIDCAGEITAVRVFNAKGESESPYNKLLSTKDDLVYYWGTPTTLYSNLDQYSKDNYLYLRSEKNPNTDYERIEIGEDKHLFDVKFDNVTVDGICFKYGAGHAVSGGTIKNLTVRNCVFAWIGGGLLNGANPDNKGSRYGNAIEIFGGCDGFYVHNNWIYEIFDTGITFQYHYSSGSYKMVNVEIYDNLVENCYWSLEWWISPKSGAQKNPEVSNIHVHDNILREGFNSWGTLHHSLPTGGAMLSSSFGTNNLSNFVIENNIFDRTYVAKDPSVQTRMLNISISSGNANIEYKGNVFLQYTDQLIAKVSHADGENTFTGSRAKIKSFIKLMDKNGGVDMTSNFFCVVEPNK